MTQLALFIINKQITNLLHTFNILSNSGLDLDTCTETLPDPLLLS